jgi:ferritin
MLISEVLNAAMNTQIGNELGNSNQYIAIASYFESEGLSLLAKIYFNQATEERDHAMRFVKFVLDAGGKVVVPAINELAFDSEARTTQQIYHLVDLAVAEKNHIASNFLQWFVSEQLEEMASSEKRLTVIKRSGPNVLMVEAYLAHGGG